MSRGRETVEERRARLMPGAMWIVTERERRGWSGRELARRLDIAQDRVSAYQRAQDEPPDDLVPVLARVFELDEVEVWRQLGKRLPGPFRTDQEAFAYYHAKYPDVFAGALDDLPPPDGDPGANRRRPGVRPPAVPHKGDKEEEPSQRRASSH